MSDSKYFSTTKKGEIHELKEELRSLDRPKKKEAVKKVIAAMTVGKDVSMLFPDVVNCMQTEDLELKKLVYLYLINYAKTQPDLAIMAVNTFVKDSQDPNPLIRALAVRTMGCIRVDKITEYLCDPLERTLKDEDPYVRKTAVMGVLKIYHIDQAVVANTGMLERVRHMLYTDQDANVLANCLVVMTQVEGVEKLAERNLLYALLNRLKEFSDWAQCAVLELAASYTPSGEAEVYDLLNALEERLGAANSAVVLAATKAFLLLTLALPATHQQVLERIKEPLKSLIGRDDPATGYAVLAHVALLAARAPIIFEGDHTAFYCRTHDPSYVKKLKMEILASIASSMNVYDIVSELSEYARDVVTPSMAREAVRAVGRIALQVPDASGVVERLLIFLDSGCDQVVAEALVQMKDLLRRYPDMAEVVVSQLGGALHDLSPEALAEADARAALVWIVGQFGQHIPDAPYLLEPLAEGWPAEEAPVRAALLTAAVQLFFRRPPEAAKLLGTVLSHGVVDTHQDVHDRALLYYRLLRTHVAEGERLINPPLLAVAAFAEELSQEVKDAIFQEFNSLSVVYQAPASTFVDRVAYHSLALADDEEPATAFGHHPGGGEGAGDLLAIDNATNLLDDVDGAPAATIAGTDNASHSDLLDLVVPSVSSSVPAAAAAGSTSTSAAGAGSLLGGGWGGLASTPPAPAAAVPQAGTSAAGGMLPDFFSDMPGLGAPAAPAAPAPAVAAAGGLLGGLGDLGSLMGGFGAAPALPLPGAAAHAGGAGFGGGLLDDFDLGSLGAPAPAPAPARPAVPELHLNPSARVSPAVFQDKWKSLPVAHTQQDALTPATLAALAANAHKDFTAHVAQAYIQTIASGGQQPTYKYYFYGQQSGSNSLLLVELVVRTDTRIASLTVKAEETALVPQFVELWGACFMGFWR
mmetsp:Transcript_32786/g.83214  ORF Transcript_32786/g.83214 Transcript_32786/m.83214 type:complete len:924 (-) Transcript_32786:319-3090(-)